MSFEFPLEFAMLIRDMVGGTSSIEYLDPVQDDPQQRRPDISRANKELNWQPLVPLKVGLDKTIEYFRKELLRSSHSERNIFHPHDILSSEKAKPQSCKA
jgi:UDP-glucuronate decarboxylase